MDASEMVTLKNGNEVPRVSVNAAMLSLRSLEREDPITLFGLHAFCRDRNHIFFTGSAGKLMRLGLLSKLEGGDYFVNEVTRAIVLSAVEGEGLDIRVVSPLPE